MLFYQARCAPSPNDHRSHIFPYLLCYVTMVPAHSILHEAFALGGYGMFFQTKMRSDFTYPLQVRRERNHL